MNQTPSQNQPIEDIIKQSEKMLERGAYFYFILIVALSAYILIFLDSSILGLPLVLLSIGISFLPRPHTLLNHPKWQLWALLNVENLRELEKEAFKRGWFTKVGFRLTPRQQRKLSNDQIQVISAKLEALEKPLKPHIPQKQQFSFNRPLLHWYQDVFIVGIIILNILLTIIAVVLGLWALLSLLPVSLFIISKRAKELKQRRITELPAFTIDSQGVEVWIKGEILPILWEDIKHIWVKGDDLNMVFCSHHPLFHQQKRMNLTLKYVHIPNDINLNRLFAGDSQPTIS